MVRNACVWVRFMVVGAMVAVVPAAASAQTFEYGVKIGLAVTGVPNSGEVVDQVVGAPSSESSSRLGLAGGGYIRFPLTDRLGFQPELLFVMKGVELSERGNSGTVGVRLNYFDVPLLIRYRIPLNDKYTGFLVAGPNFGIKLGSSAKLDGSTGGTVDEDIDPALKTLDLGLAFGGGVVMKRFFLEGRFVAGLTDIATPNFPHQDSLRNRTFLAVIGMKLP